MIVSEQRFGFSFPICAHACESISSQELPVPSTLVKAAKSRIAETKEILYEINEPHHDITNIMGLQPAWIQTSLRIRAV
jgi:hypothetical protein